MISLNLDAELWFAEAQQEPAGEVGPLCCWFFDCWGS